MDDRADDDLLRYYSRYFTAEVVDLSVSNPPPPVIDFRELSHRLQTLSYVPPAGASALMERVAARYRTVAPEEVLVTAGASEGLAALALALVRRGSSVVADPSVYPSFIESAKIAGGHVHLTRDPATPADVAVTCNPTAPGGQLVDLPRFIRQAASAGGIPVVDEVFRDLPLRPEPIAAAVDLSERAVSIGDLSKPIGTGGLRIGWLVTHDTGVRDRLDRQLQLLSGGPATPSLPLAEFVLDHFDEWVAGTVETATRNGREVCEVLAAAGWTFDRPCAGITVSALPPFAVTGSAEQRLRDAGYFLVPCRVFGIPGEYRVSLLAPPDHLRRALRILAGKAA